MTLAEFLKENGETASAFASRTGISQPYVSRLISGERFPHREVIEAIWKATGGKVTANDFIQGATPEETNSDGEAAA